MNSIRRHLTPLFTSILALTLLAGCGDAEPEAAQTQERPATVVDAVAAQRLEVKRTIDALGSLKASERVTVSPEIDGVIKSVHFKEGEKVSGGGAKAPVLFRLDDSMHVMEVKNAEALLRMAEADLAQKKASFQRQKIMYEENATTEAAYTDAKLAEDRAEAAKSQAEAALDISRERLSKTVIQAPLRGILGERDVSPGDYVNSGEKLVEIVSVDPMDITFSVPENYQSDLRTGLEVELATDALPDQDIRGEIFYVSPDVDVATRTIRMKARVPNKDGALKPGLFMRVQLSLGEQTEMVVVPEEAVVPRGDKYLVYIVENDLARSREIIIGQRLPGQVAVIQGLDGNETVITAGLQRVADGFPVTIRQTPQ